MHPADNIAANQLDVPEERWFYTMFLQALGRYLEYKRELGQNDEAVAYARACLLHYATWMAVNEHPYLSKPEKLVYPTETWPAQDVRKSDIFFFAALQANADDRDRFLERARFFYRSAIVSVGQMPTRTLARPVVILSTSGFMSSWYAERAHPPAPAPVAHDFGAPVRFIPQRRRAEERAKWLGVAGLAAAILVAALLWWR